MIVGPFYDQMPGPEHRDKLNEMFNIWEQALLVAAGDDGWSPLIRAVTFGERVVLEVYDWVGGEGTKPTATGFIGPAGLVSNQANAANVAGTKGDKGEDGEDGSAATVAVEGTETLAPGLPAQVINVGTASAARFVFKIPQGAKGDQGLKGDDGTSFEPDAVGLFSARAAHDNEPSGFAYLATDQGLLYFRQGASGWSEGMPFGKGEKGDPGIDGTDGTNGVDGTSATIQVSSTTTGAPGTNASVTNVGTSQNVILQFTVPRGEKGDKGDKGTDGTNGTNGTNGVNATISVGTTTTGAAGTPAQVTNTGTATNAVLSFVIPKGDKGDPGTNGVTSVNGLSGDVLLNFMSQPGPSVPVRDKYFLMADSGLNGVDYFSSSDGAGSDWPTADPVCWWNVLTLGSPGRVTQLAVQVMRNVTAPRAVMYIRALHDNQWSVWRASSGGDTNPIGTFFTGTQKPSTGTWLEPGLYLQSSYAELYAQLGLLQNDGPTDYFALPIPVSTNTVVEAVAYGNGKYIAVCSSGDYRVMESVDGRGWQARPLPSNLSGISWYDVIFTGSVFIAVGNSNLGAYSSDGITWTSFALPSSASWRGLCAGNGYVLAFSSDSQTVARAQLANLSSWTSFNTLPSASTWTSCAFGGGRWVVIARNAGGRVAAVSTDNGATWTAGTLPAGASAIPVKIVYGAGIFVAAAIATSSGWSTASSTDGVTWTSRTTAESSNTQPVTLIYGDAGFALIVSGGASTNSRWWTSVNGISWSARTTLVFGSQQNVSCGVFGHLGTYTALVNNTNATPYMLSALQVSSAVFSSGTGSLSGSDIHQAYRWAGSKYLNGRHIAWSNNVSALGGAVAVSVGGVQWNVYGLQRTVQGNQLVDAEYANGMYMFIGWTYSITTADFESWTRNVTGSLGNMTKLAAVGDRFVVSHTTAPNMSYSSDGATWTACNTPTNLAFSDAASSPTRSLFRRQNDILTTTDGINFSTLTNAQATGTKIQYLNGEFWLYGGETLAFRWSGSDSDPYWYVSEFSGFAPVAMVYAAPMYVAISGGGLISVSEDKVKWSLKANTYGVVATAGLTSGGSAAIGIGNSSVGTLYNPKRYDTSTQFYVPKPANPVSGMKTWVKAR